MDSNVVLLLLRQKPFWLRSNMHYRIKLVDNTSKNLGLHDVTIFYDGEKMITHGFSSLDKAKGFVSGYALALKSLGKEVMIEG